MRCADHSSAVRVCVRRRTVEGRHVAPKNRTYPILLRYSWELLLVPAAVIIILSCATYARNSVFHDKIRLWEDTTRKSFKKTRPHYVLGDAYSEAGRIDESLREFQTAVIIRPDDAQALFNRGSLFFKLGRLDDAIADFDRAIARNPSYIKAYNNRGVAFLKKGSYREALRDFDEVLTLDPANSFAIYNRRLVMTSLTGP